MKISKIRVIIQCLDLTLVDRHRRLARPTNARLDTELTGVYTSQELRCVGNDLLESTLISRLKTKQYKQKKLKSRPAELDFADADADVVSYLA